MGGLSAVLTRGLGGRVPQTAHPSEFNTIVADPSLFHINHPGTEGDPEYAVWTPEPHNSYNARALHLYAPEGLLLSPRSLSRLRNLAEVLKPLTCSVRMSPVKGVPHFELLDEAEDPQ